MSISPTVLQHDAHKRRRLSEASDGYEQTIERRMLSPDDMSMDAGLGGGAGSAHIPKRGARACTACRKGKNRCEGEVRRALGLHLSRTCADGGPAARADTRCAAL